MRNIMKLGFKSWLVIGITEILLIFFNEVHAYCRMKPDFSHLLKMLNYRIIQKITKKGDCTITSFLESF